MRPAVASWHWNVSKLSHLAGVFDQIDALLPSSDDTLASGPSNTSTMSDAEELCARAESIRDRVKLVMEGRIGSASVLGEPELCDRKGTDFCYHFFFVMLVPTPNVLAFPLPSGADLKANSTEQLHSLPPKAEPNMDTSSEVSLYHSQYPQHSIPPSHCYHRLQEYQQYQHQSHHVNCERQSHQLPLQPTATATTVTYRHDPHVVSSARHSLVIDDDLCLPVGHVQRLKKKLSASLTTSGSNHVPSDLRAIPRQIPGAKELFGASATPPDPAILFSSGMRSPSLSSQRQLPPLAPRRQSTKDEIVSLQKNVASMAAAAALQRNMSVRAKEVIIDGCGGGGGGGKGSVRDLAVSRSVAVGLIPPLLSKSSISVQTQTEPFNACPWWTMLETPGWRQSSMSFSAASSGIGMDDGSNFQDDFSSVSKSCFVCCKHSAVAAGVGGTNRPQSGTTSFCPAPDLLQEDSVTEELRGKATKPLRQACGDSSGSIAQPMIVNRGMWDRHSLVRKMTVGGACHISCGSDEPQWRASTSTVWFWLRMNETQVIVEAQHSALPVKHSTCFNSQTPESQISGSIDTHDEHECQMIR
ncbi:unnamed protein product [Hydatigera taeniaeformis]|uniref:SH2 domain-containing protein n=1 Tax=Hydatigena taeniaeformis TaxID=6205 RepID=A0A0R3X928_HYDTA|nr:unnamed protein product [Hydatigera taeniaeformis]